MVCDTCKLKHICRYEEDLRNIQRKTFRFIDFQEVKCKYYCKDEKMSMQLKSNETEIKESGTVSPKIQQKEISADSLRQRMEESFHRMFGDDKKTEDLGPSDKCTQKETCDKCGAIVPVNCITTMIDGRNLCDDCYSKEEPIVF